MSRPLPGGKLKIENPCRRCLGKGQVLKKKTKGSKIFWHKTPCPRCWGDGKIVPAGHSLLS